LALRTKPASKDVWATACGRLLATALGGVVAVAAAPAAHADLIVPANAVVTLNGGNVDLACGDFTAAGTLQVNTSSVNNVGNAAIQAGGTVDGGAGVVTLGGNWSNAGTFIPGSSSVRFRDICPPTSATISGNTTFSTASFVSMFGKHYAFGVGSTQTVTGILEIAGTTPQPIQFLSGAPGQVAYINLLPGAPQLIQHVGVTDVWATGQWLAPNLTNEGGGGNAKRWFGAAAIAAQTIPTLADAALAALAALLAVTGAWLLRRRAACPPRRQPAKRARRAARMRP
jgi:IPTL-CTERM motif